MKKLLLGVVSVFMAFNAFGDANCTQFDAVEAAALSAAKQANVGLDPSEISIAGGSGTESPVHLSGITRDGLSEWTVRVAVRDCFQEFLVRTESDSCESVVGTARRLNSEQNCS